MENILSISIFLQSKCLLSRLFEQFNNKLDKLQLIILKGFWYSDINIEQNCLK